MIKLNEIHKNKVGKIEGFKVIVHPKIQILLSLVHPLQTWMTMNKVGIQTAQAPIYVYSMNTNQCK